MTDDGQVLPFTPRKPAKPERVDVPGDHLLHLRTQRAKPGARALVLEQSADAREQYQRAASRQRTERLIATGKVVPARITLALDVRGLEGPEVDTACGAVEPDVDRWELGLAVPTADQVKLLAELTRFPIAYFYEPLAPGPLIGGGGPVWMCYQRKVDGSRCHPVDQDVVDENGVLLYGGKPRELPDVQGALF